MAQVPGAAARTVLVVEDEPMLLIVIAETLRDAGFVVLEAARGEAALALLGQNPNVSLLLSDVKMPGMNGYEVVEKGLALRPDLKILFMTGYSKGPAPKAIADLNIPTVNKPFDFDKLPKLVDDILSGN